MLLVSFYKLACAPLGNFFDFIGGGGFIGFIGGGGFFDFIGGGGFNPGHNSILFTYMTSVWPQLIA